MVCSLDQNSAAVEYTNLKVEVETRRDLLNELLRKQSETEVTVRLYAVPEAMSTVTVRMATLKRARGCPDPSGAR